MASQHNMETLSTMLAKSNKHLALKLAHKP